MDSGNSLPIRKNIRLKDYDYSIPGAYFVTIMVNNREQLFGNISNELFVLNWKSQIVIESWKQLEINYPYVVLDEYCLMPDHFHGIIFILNKVQPSTLTTVISVKETIPKIKPLGQLIGAFKTISTKQINISRNTPGETVWQRNYYDRVIRKETELGHIRTYIMENPSRWSKE